MTEYRTRRPSGRHESKVNVGVHLWSELEMETSEQPRQGRGVVHARQRLADAVPTPVAEGNVPLHTRRIRLPHLCDTLDP